MGEEAAPTKQHCRHIEEGVEMLSRERLDVCQNMSFQRSVSQLGLFSDITLILIFTSPLTPACLSSLTFFFFKQRQLFPFSNKKNTIPKNLLNFYLCKPLVLCFALLH